MLQPLHLYYWMDHIIEIEEKMNSLRTSHEVVKTDNITQLFVFYNRIIGTVSHRYYMVYHPPLSFGKRDKSNNDFGHF